MTASWMPVIFVEIIGSILTLGIAFGCAIISRQWTQKKPEDIFRHYIYLLTIAIVFFAISRSFGHLIKQILLLNDLGSIWQQIAPFSGAINSTAFVVIFAFGLYFHRFQKVHLDIERHQTRLEQEVAVRKEAEISLQLANAKVASEKLKLENANREFKNLLKRSHTNIKERFANQNLLKCWEVTNCRAEKCPSYGSEDRRCWQKVGTFCAGPEHIKLAEKIRHCESCEVYLHATSDPITSIGEYFNNLMSILEERAMELEKASREAAQASRIKSEFLANMSHEIRTPLAGIIGMLELAIGNSVDEEQNNMFFTINSEVDSLLSIINNVLDFSKIEAGKLELEKIPFDLGAMIEDVSASHALGAHRKRLELVSLIDPATPLQLVGDPGRLRQILTNLIGNALKFTNEGEIMVQAGMVEDLADAVKIHFQVTDTGIGIPPDKQQLIFESFTQVDGSTTRKYGGTGLGTSICKQLIAMMDGTIGVDSEEGKGSNFWFTIVFKKQKDNQSEIGPLIDNDLFGLRILLVDDNQASLAAVKTYCLSWGCQVIAAASGSEALAQLKESMASPAPFNLILTDQQMPGMDGFELVAQIRTGLPTTTIPIVMFTSVDSPGDGKRCLEKGISGYLTKPIRRKALFNAMKTVLGFALPEETMAAQNQIIPQSHIEKFGANIPRVLLVEDYPTNQQVATMHLEGAGYQVELAENGRQAVDAYQSRSYDIVLMDVQMPEMDGYEATRLIRDFEREKGNRTPIVAMTAHASEEDRSKCLAAGMDDFISKPLRRKTLLLILAKWLGEKNSTANVAKAKISTAPGDVFAGETEDPPVDLNFALHEFLGDKELLQEVAVAFIQSAQERMALVGAAIMAGDGKVISHEGHTLKGGAGTLCAEKLAAIAYQLEKAGAAEDFAQSAKYFAQFKNEFERFVAFVKNM
ncbi:MAG: response regulator [Proteobacteria bacterium]|nr:response regulator [Pseudomonadota bacterium]MBU1717113.1 response regulator [Pseudomonadota bacterium]